MWVSVGLRAFRTSGASEQQLQRQLNLARLAVDRADHAGTGVERRTSKDLGIGSLEGCMIQDIESFRSEFQSAALSQRQFPIFDE